MTRCIATASGYVVADEHLDGCEGTCRGCWPCVPMVDGYPASHCTARARCTEHIADGLLTCPRCLHKTRSVIRRIADLTPLLPVAAVESGRIEGEAFNLAGPAADPAGWSAVKVQAIHDGTIDLLPEDDEAHPYAVTTRWQMMLAEDYGHTFGRTDVAQATAYLDGQLDRIAQDPEQDFPLFTREMTACLARVEAALSVCIRPELSRVPCIDCGARLHRRYNGAASRDDHWCPVCRRSYSDGEYTRAQAQWLASEGADRFVPISEAVNAVQRPEHTIRTWMRRGLVRHERDEKTARLLVWWPDVRERHKAAETRRLSRKAG